MNIDETDRPEPLPAALQRLTRMYRQFGFDDEQAAKAAAHFEPDLHAFLAELHGAADYWLGSRGAMVMAVLATIIVRRDPPAALPAADLDEVAHDFDELLGEGLYGPFFLSKD